MSIESVNPHALGMFAVCSAILAVQLLLLAFWTGMVRIRRKQYVNPEDAKISNGLEVDADHPDVMRVKRAHQNALENAVPFFIVGLMYAFTGPNKQGFVIYYATFTAARVLHSIFYLWGKQPFRTMMFAIGALATLGMATRIVIVSL